MDGNQSRRPKLYITTFIKLHLCSKLLCILHICQDLLICCCCAAQCSRVQLQLAIIKNKYSFYFSTCSLKSTVVIKLFPLYFLKKVNIIIHPYNISNNQFDSSFFRNNFHFNCQICHLQSIEHIVKNSVINLVSPHKSTKELEEIEKFIA